MQSVSPQVSWTHALRQIVINCYKFHNREDLLPAFSEEDDKGSTKDGATVSAKDKVKNRSATLTVQSVAGTLTTNAGLTTVTSIADPNSAIAQTVNVCSLPPFTFCPPVLLVRSYVLLFHPVSHSPNIPSIAANVRAADSVRSNYGPGHQ